jgi:thioredoxin reductase (NADPH)
MAGTEYLVEARKIVPEAKRVLLTAYADTEAAIAAINEVALDFYLLKPWDPPEEQLYPVLQDLLTTWESGALLESGGVRVIGHRFSKESHDVRDFLARSRIPARWLDVERDSEARELLNVVGVSADRLPVALMEDGSVLERPTLRELATRLGVASMPLQEHYDLVIVGGGPAGLAAAVYGASEGLRTVMVEQEATGGQAGQSSRIENYLGFPMGLSGSDLARRGTDQARRLGAELLTVREVVSLEVDGAGRFIRLGGEEAQLSANCVLVASGVSYNQLQAPGFAELTGAGIYYGAALSEARSCADQHVVVIGGANSAGQAAVYFSGYASRVTMLVRGESLTKSMSKYLVEQLEALPNVEIRTRSQAVAAEGDDHLRQLRIRDADGNEALEDVDACFVFIGAAPRTDWLDGVVARDEKGFILSGLDIPDGGWPLHRDPMVLETSVPGVFVAGDVRARSIKRVASAVGEGSMAVSLIHQYLAAG